MTKLIYFPYNNVNINHERLINVRNKVLLDRSDGCEIIENLSDLTEGGGSDTEVIKTTKLREYFSATGSSLFINAHSKTEARLKVLKQHRATGLTIQYYHRELMEIIEETYIGNSFSDIDWVNDDNWSSKYDEYEEPYIRCSETELWLDEGDKTITVYSNVDIQITIS